MSFSKSPVKSYKLPVTSLFLEREHLKDFDVSWGHEPDRRRSRSHVRFTMYDLRAPRSADGRARESRRAAISPSEVRKSYIVNRWARETARSESPGLSGLLDHGGGVKPGLSNALFLTAGPGDFQGVEPIRPAQADRDRQFRLRKITAGRHHLAGEGLRTDPDVP